MRLIDTDKLKEWILEFHPADAYWAISMLENAPTVDAEPVVHAHWIKIGDEKEGLYQCSNCGRPIRTTGYKLINYPYCHCGAKMDEEVKVNG